MNNKEIQDFGFQPGEVEIPKQEEFYKLPRRFGSVPVDEAPHHPDLFPKGANRLFFGDNLHVMRQLPSNSIDLIYIDPPFFSNGKN